MCARKCLGFAREPDPLRCPIWKCPWRPQVISTIRLQRRSGVMADRESPRRSTGIKPFKERGTKQQEVASALNPTVPTRGWKFSHRICRRGFTLSPTGCEQVRWQKGVYPEGDSAMFHPDFIKILLVPSTTHGKFTIGHAFHQELK